MTQFLEHTRMGQNLSPVGTPYGSPPLATYNYVYIYLSEVAGFDMRSAVESGSGNHAMVFAEAEVMATSNAATTCGCVIKRVKGVISNSTNTKQENDAVNGTVADATVPFESAWWPILDVKLEMIVDGSASPDYKHSLRLGYAIDEAAVDVGVHWEIKCKIWKPV
jgi:hypothetical protein